MQTSSPLPFKVRNPLPFPSHGTMNIVVGCNYSTNWRGIALQMALAACFSREIRRFGPGPFTSHLVFEDLKRIAKNVARECAFCEKKRRGLSVDTLEEITNQPFNDAFSDDLRAAKERVASAKRAGRPTNG